MTALEFRAVIENVLQILIGCPLDFQPGTNSKQVRTWYFKSSAKNCPHHKGVFGHVTAYFGCIETQARGALHFHVILWGGITPKLLEEASSFPDICEHISKALDTMYTAEAPSEKLAEGFIIRRMKETVAGRSHLPCDSKIYPVMKHVPSPKSSKEVWQRYMWENILHTEIPVHSFTCKKTACRQAQMQGSILCRFKWENSTSYVGNASG